MTYCISHKYFANRRKIMAKKIIVMAILALTLVFGMTVVGCNNGGGGDDEETKETISAKWEISNADIPYSSFEFTTDDVYIVIEKTISRNIHSSRSVFGNNSDENKQTIRERAAESNLSPVHTGRYEIDGDKIILEGFGLVNIISITAEEFNFSFKLEKSDKTYDIKAARVEDSINESSRTKMLCRAWKVEKVSDPEENEMIGYGVLFSRAGTYLVTYNDGTAGLAEWKWMNTEETKLQYSWDNWRNSGSVEITELTATKLSILEHGLTIELGLAK
jgi:hypothetical protein